MASPTLSEIEEYVAEYKAKNGRLPWKCVIACHRCPNAYCITEGVTKGRGDIIVTKDGKEMRFETIGQVAEHLGVSSTTVQRYLSGKRKPKGGMRIYYG